MSQQEMGLILKAVSGDPESFGRLVERSSPAIIGLIYSVVGNWETARDLTQESFLKAYLKLNTLHHPERFESWLRQIAVNQARSYLRGRSKQQTVPLDEVAAADQAQPLAGSLVKQEILQSLASLPDGTRTALVMHYLLGLSPVDAAKALQISRGAFDTRLSRGREMLQERLLHLVDEALADEKGRIASYLAGLAQGVRSAIQGKERSPVAAARELALLAARANLPRLAADLQSPHDATRKRAAQLLGETADLRAVPALLQALAHEEEAPVLAAICQSLAAVGAVEAIPTLQALARQTAEMTVHKAATAAASRLAQAGHVVRPDIPVTIADLQAGGIEGLLLDLLSDPRPEVQVQAIDGLGRVESVAAIPRLLARLAAAQEGYIRLATVAALGGVLGAPARVRPALRTQTVTALAEALADPEPGVVAEAGRALAQAGYHGDEQLQRFVMDRFFSVIEELVRKPGPWWVTFPGMLAVFATPVDLVRLLRFTLSAAVAQALKAPLGCAVELLAAPGQPEVVPLLLEAAQRGILPGAMVRALGRCQAEAEFIARCLGPDFPVELQPHPQYSPAQQRSRVRQAAATALAGGPGGREALASVWSAWRGQAEPDEPALLALVAGLEAAGGPLGVLGEIAQAAGVGARVQVSARAAAKRLEAEGG